MEAFGSIYSTCREFKKNLDFHLQGLAFDIQRFFQQAHHKKGKRKMKT